MGHLLPLRLSRTPLPGAHGGAKFHVAHGRARPRGERDGRYHGHQSATMRGRSA